MIDQLNWAGNYRYSAAKLHSPETVEQLQELVGQCRKLKALGTRHSFNSIADTTEDLVSLAHLHRIVALDPELRTVTVEAGITYSQLCPELHRQGFALPNLASLPHISVGGACATATHGSGSRNGVLATCVSALEMVTADGEVKTLSRAKDGEQFQGAVVGLGGLGMVTKLTLDIVPTFVLRQDIYENLPLTRLEDHFEEIFASAYSVSLFTDWRSTTFNQVWIKSQVVENASFTEPELFEATPATHPLHPIGNLSPESCTGQMGVPGPWQERLTHFRIDFTPSVGEELQAEYLVPRHHAYAAICAVAELREQIAPLLQVSEIRTIAADTLWMSPCYQQPCVGIHFTWYRDWPAVEQLLPKIEAQLAPFRARPHWGKLFTMSATQLTPLYPKLPDFRQLLHSYDPQGKFRNAFLDTNLFGNTTT